MGNLDNETVRAALTDLFSEMHVEVPSIDTDLFDSGILDSQRLVELLFHIEQNFNTKIDVEDFELENFRCIEKIAALILQRRQERDASQLSKVV